MNKNDGGPAFPVTPENYDMSGYCGEGMTLRDYFAAKASEEDIKQFMPDRSGLQGHAITDMLAKNRQQARYMHADAMLAERAK